MKIASLLLVEKRLDESPQVCGVLSRSRLGMMVIAMHSCRGHAQQRGEFQVKVYASAQEGFD